MQERGRFPFQAFTQIVPLCKLSHLELLYSWRGFFSSSLLLLCSVFPTTTFQGLKSSSSS